MNLTTDKVMETLHAVIDPEVGLSIVDMGLVYDIKFQEPGVIEIQMTLTTPGCPMESYMKEEVVSVLTQFSDVKEVRVEIVWDPPWSPGLISPGAMDALHNGTYVPGSTSEIKGEPDATR